MTTRDEFPQPLTYTLERRVVDGRVIETPVVNRAELEAYLADLSLAVEAEMADGDD